MRLLSRVAPSERRIRTRSSCRSVARYNYTDKWYLTKPWCHGHNAEQVKTDRHRRRRLLTYASGKVESPLNTAFVTRPAEGRSDFHIDCSSPHNSRRANRTTLCRYWTDPDSSTSNARNITPILYLTCTTVGTWTELLPHSIWTLLLSSREWLQYILKHVFFRRQTLPLHAPVGVGRCILVTSHVGEL